MLLFLKYCIGLAAQGYVLARKKMKRIASNCKSWFQSVKIYSFFKNMQASCIAYYFSGLKYAEKTGVDSQRDCVAFEIDRLKV